MSFSDAPKRIDPVVPTSNEVHDLSEKGKANWWSVTLAPVSSGPKSESQRRGPLSTRYREPSGVKRSVWALRSNRFAFPSAPSSNSITIRSPLVETLPMECPGSFSCCAYDGLNLGTDHTKPKLHSPTNRRHAFSHHLQSAKKAKSPLAENT